MCVNLKKCTQFLNITRKFYKSHASLDNLTNFKTCIRTLKIACRVNKIRQNAEKKQKSQTSKSAYKLCKMYASKLKKLHANFVKHMQT